MTFLEDTWSDLRLFQWCSIFLVSWFAYSDGEKRAVLAWRCRDYPRCKYFVHFSECIFKKTVHPPPANLQSLFVLAFVTLWVISSRFIDWFAMICSRTRQACHLQHLRTQLQFVLWEESCSGTRHWEGPICVRCENMKTWHFFWLATNGNLFQQWHPDLDFG